MTYLIYWYRGSHYETCRFCISKDRKWIGALGGNLGTCSLISVVSGAVVCQIEISACEMSEATLVFSDVTFDASERHLWLFSEEVILALAPAALNIDALMIPRTLLWREDILNKRPASSNPTPAVTKERLHASVELFSMLSPEAFDFAVTKSLDASSVAWCFGLTTRSLVGCDSAQKIRGVGHAAEWDYLACIVTDTNFSETRVRIWHLTSDHVRLPRDFAGLRFPLSLRYGKTAAGFVPAKLAFYRTESAEDRMALLPADYRPTVILCRVSEESWEAVDLEMERCLSFCHTENQQRLCLLDVSGVCVLDLESKTIVSRVGYRVNFCELMAMVVEAQLGERNWEHYVENSRTRLLASDGQTVLLAWDATNGRSIVVTRATEQQECRQLISEADGNLKFNCGISGNGACGYFWTKPTGFDDLPKRFCVFSIPGTHFHKISALSDVL